VVGAGVLIAEHEVLKTVGAPPQPNAPNSSTS
jgi:hypothetical protein